MFFFQEILTSLNSKFGSRQKSEYKTIDRLKQKHIDGLKDADGVFTPPANQHLFVESPRRQCQCTNADLLSQLTFLQTIAAVAKVPARLALAALQHKENLKEI